MTEGAFVNFLFLVNLFKLYTISTLQSNNIKYHNHNYPLSYGVPVRERYGSTLLPATREQHDQNCTQSH